eukprot:3497526-Heterocapsa_arctica.AAC.1
MSRRKPSTRSRCLAPPFARFSFCQLEPAVQGIDAITCAPGKRRTSSNDACNVSARRKSPVAV